MEKNQKQLGNHSKELNKIIQLFERLAKALKQGKFYEAYHFMMVSRMSFEDTICLKNYSQINLSYSEQ